jgi:hypothetical protein
MFVVAPTTSWRRQILVGFTLLGRLDVIIPSDADKWTRLQPSALSFEKRKVSREYLEGVLNGR